MICNIPGELRRIFACALSALLALFAACRPADEGQPWAHAAVAIPAPVVAGSRYPNLATGPDGTILLSWTSPAPDGAHSLQYATYTRDGWSSAATAVTGRDWFVNWADFGSVVPLGDSLLAAHWLAQRPGGAYSYDVRLSVSRDRGATWSAPISPHTDGTATEHGFVSLAADGDQVVAVWLDGRNTGGEGGHESHSGAMTLRTATMRADDVTPEVEAEIDGRVCDCCQTDAARTPDGLVVVYRDRDAGETRDIALVRETDAGWSAPVPVHHDGWKIAACPVNGPAIAAHGRSVAVAWFTAPDQPRIRLAFSSDAGRSFAPALEVASGRVVGRVDLVLIDQDRAVVSWLSEAAGGAEIRAQLWTRAGAVAPPVMVARSSAERASGFPRMAVTGDTLLFAWTEAGATPIVRTAAVRLH